MVSSEFKATISEKNLLRARIMLKDSFVVDPTFIQLNEMLSYAKANLPNLMVPYDGDNLEDTPSKWNRDTMNEELVQLVTNFSEIRINHLKKVVAKVMESEVEQIRVKRIAQNQQQTCSVQAIQNPASKSSVIRKSYSPAKDSARRDALKTLQSAARKINKVMFEVESNKGWRSNNIDEMERAARVILKAVQDYKDNR